MDKKFVGFDIGTGNLVSSVALDISDKDKIKSEVKSMRNMFFPISLDNVSVSDIKTTTLNYVEIYGNNGELEKLAIIGEDAFKWANIFGKEVCRPMENGVLSNKNIDSYDIIGGMVKGMIVDENESNYSSKYCVFSVPAEPIDESIPSVSFHEKVFSKIFSKLKYVSRSLNEGMAVIYSNCKKEEYTGIGISFGAGLTNVAISYKGMPAVTFSVCRGGDWIDRKSSEALGKLVTRITNIKENNFNLYPDTYKNDKKDIRVIKECIYIFYNELINYVLMKICEKIKDISDNINIDIPIPIVLSGGTSLVDGFKEVFVDIFTEKYEKDFPFNVSEIRYSVDRLYSVSLGCLEYCVLLFG